MTDYLSHLLPIASSHFGYPDLTEAFSYQLTVYGIANFTVFNFLPVLTTYLEFSQYFPSFLAYSITKFIFNELFAGLWNHDIQSDG